MKIHKEGIRTIAISVLLFVVINLLFFFAFRLSSWLCIFIFLVTLVLFGLILYFFRIPNHSYSTNENCIYAPCDGEVVVIEEVLPDEYFTEKRLQMSIFMSPLNVHINRNPISGSVVYNKYHKGKYLVAWHPKSSTDNERHSVVIKNTKGEVLVKQIAGAVARRIVNYMHINQQAVQNAELGFIKFGSRVDVLLPLNATICVNIGDKPIGGVTVLAKW